MKHKNVKICVAAFFSLVLTPFSVVVKAEILEWQGSFQQGSLLLGQLPEGYQASYDKQRLQVQIGNDSG